MDEKAIVMLKKNEFDPGIDIEIPLNISANEFIYGLNQSFNLGINMDDPKECYLRASNPITLIKGEKTLEEHGIRNGTSIFTAR
jgi:uncharacterized ubiquitin-like protein YukD